MTFHDYGWKHAEGGLVLCVGDRATPVPAPIDALLTDLDGLGLSPTPGVDVLRVESRLRHLVAAHGAELHAVERRVAAIRRSVEDQAPAVRLGREGRESLADVLSDAVEHHARISGQFRRAQDLLRRLRDFVCVAGPPSGWLREAAEGWRRGSERPASVTTYASEDAYLDADPRRAAATDWGGRRIDGIEDWGRAWRRDGDDDDPAAADDGRVHREGPWAIGYIGRTGDLYAIRRAGHLPDEVWGLGTLIDTAESASSLFGPIADRMREPNSIVLAAAVVHQATRRWVA